MRTPPVQAVIFDLDGTLVQTRAASWEIFARISERFELGIDRPEQYFELFNGNVYASIARLCRDADQAELVNSAFLQLLREEYTPPLIPGVSEVVRRLAADCTLAVMSSNAMAVLRRVLVTNGLAFCFAHVFGGDVTPDKRTAMRTFLADAGTGFGRRCAADYDERGQRHEPEPGATVLVTDTVGDVRDAREVGIRAVGVAWGMHSVDELTEAGAEFVALWPQEITSYLLGDDAARPPTGSCALPRGPGITNDAAPLGVARSGAGRPSAASTGCGCGCAGTGCPVRSFATGGTADPARQAASVRRQRRQRAALTSAPSEAAPEPPVVRAGEVLQAIRRICGYG